MDVPRGYDMIIQNGVQCSECGPFDVGPTFRLVWIERVHAGGRDHEKYNSEWSSGVLSIGKNPHAVRKASAQTVSKPPQKEKTR